MTNLGLFCILLLAVFAATRAQTTTACPFLDETKYMPPQEVDEMNQAILSARSSFNNNPVTSDANAAWSTAIEAAPASVTSSLYCSGYGGIDINSLPVWLASVPTSYVSAVLQEQAVYQSIVHSYVAEASSSIESSTSSGIILSSSSASSLPHGGATSPISSFMPISTSPATTTSSATFAGQPSAVPSQSWAPQLSDYRKNGALAAICLCLALAL